MNIAPFKDRVCYECKKKFLPAPYHMFKDGKRWFCKWTCYNSYMKKKELGEERKENKKDGNSGNIPKDFEC